MSLRLGVLSLVGLAAVALQAALPSPLRGQGDDRPVGLTVDPVTGAASVVMTDLLAEPRLQQALEDGLPLRIRVRVELWRDRFFDQPAGSFEWRMNFVMDPLGGGLRVLGPGPPPRDVMLESVDAARASLETVLQPPLRPREEGRFYYLVWLEVETLSLSDIEELQRWLRGEVGPAVTNQEEMGDAFETGFGRLFVRALGLPTRRIRITSDRFEHGGGN